MLACVRAGLGGRAASARMHDLAGACRGESGSAGGRVGGCTCGRAGARVGRRAGMSACVRACGTGRTRGVRTDA